jgi:hypothetical protein
MRFVGPPVSDAPFAATAVYESSQTLADGTKIVRSTTGSIARDRQGRLRREMELNAIGPFVSEGPARRLVVIDDPVAERHYALEPDAKVARVLPPPPGGGPPPAPSGPPAEKGATVESLGRQTIEGVVCEGTRSTITLAAGQIGNDRPLKIVSERWFSPELQVIVRSTHRDPRLGETVYRLTNLERREPDRSLFLVPPDFRLDDRRPHGPRPPRPDDD